MLITYIALRDFVDIQKDEGPVWILQQVTNSNSKLTLTLEVFGWKG